MADNNFDIKTGKKNKSQDKRKAVALMYEPGNQAPQVVASGQGVIADRIIETAKSSDVPLYKDTDLTDTLLKLDIGDCIPPELYGVVAEILVYVDKMDKIKAKLDRG
jgi:flagellar biosynthesis protein